MVPELALDALVVRGVPGHIAAAIIRELVGLTAVAVVPEVAEASGIPVNQGGRQGGTETPTCWNFLLEYILQELVRHWNSAGVGFSFDGDPRINHAIWADNVYLVEESAAQLEQIFIDVSACIYKCALQWKKNELYFMPGSNLFYNSDRQVNLPDGITYELKVASELEVLGVLLDKRGSTKCSMHQYNIRTNLLIHILFSRHKVAPIYVRVLRSMFKWLNTVWHVALDDGTQPLKFYMNARPSAEKNIVQLIGEHTDNRNTSGWRHQHGGTRTHWEDLLDKADPEWKV
ncbi:unnamed protein product [Prorocentrum cordatum]|uniref:Reverse transcriptase domain-containing protein n=1 Tax=Prorocentrum cordatum TaxID=2364126 RepID=A0ABN9PJD8_9DINO|nr:unnamed protein product [Polarella glacialis]